MNFFLFECCKLKLFMLTLEWRGEANCTLTTAFSVVGSFTGTFVSITADAAIKSVQCCLNWFLVKQVVGELLVALSLYVPLLSSAHLTT